VKNCSDAGKKSKLKDETDDIFFLKAPSLCYMSIPLPDEVPGRI
jgi:hypothetical protein